MALSGRSLDDQPLAAYARRGSAQPVDDPADTVESIAAAPAARPAARQNAQAARPLAPAEAAIPAPLPADGVVDGGPAGPAVLRRAGTFARGNPRLVAGAGFVAVIVFGLALLGGTKPSPDAAGAGASPSAPAVAPVVADPGSATLVLKGSVAGTFTFAGTASQPVAGNAVTATWTDAANNLLTLDGPVDRGTRLTDAGLVLTWVLSVNGAPVTFTSKAGECTIGMASSPKAVTGSFACRKIKSADGKLTVEATGTYRT